MKKLLKNKKNLVFDCNTELHNSIEFEKYTNCKEVKIVCKYPNNYVLWTNCGISEKIRGVNKYNFFSTYGHLLKFCMGTFLNIELKKKYFNYLNVRVKDLYTNEIFIVYADSPIEYDIDEIYFRIEFNNIEYEFWVVLPDDDLFCFNLDKKWIHNSLYKMKEKKKRKILPWK